MTERNTPEAPELKRCTTCGATKLNGNGDVQETVFIKKDGSQTRPCLQCAACAQGATELVQEDPEYDFNDDGTLRRLTPDPFQEGQKAAVQRLLAALVAAMPERRIEVFHPQSGVAVHMATGYRWHVYTQESDPFRTGAITMVMFSPSLDMIYAEEHLVLAAFPDRNPTDAAELVRDLTAETEAPGTFLNETVLAHIGQEQAIRDFDPDRLLD